MKEEMSKIAALAIALVDAWDDAALVSQSPEVSASPRTTEELLRHRMKEEEHQQTISRAIVRAQNAALLLVLAVREAGSCAPGDGDQDGR